jgi:hypothetical protein
MRAPGLRLLSALLIAAFVVAGLRVGTAWAQGGAPPDLVRLKNGGMVRGTIVELVPGKEVTLVDVAGQTRKLPMSDVSYAGPAAGEPTAAPAVPAPTPTAAPAPPLMEAPPTGVRLLATEPNLTFHVLSGSSQGVGMGMAGSRPVVVGFEANHYDRLCTAPCTAALAPGSYTLALSQPDGALVAAPALTINGHEQLTGTYTSHTGARVGVFLASIAVMGLGALVGFSGKKNVCSSRNFGVDDPWTGQPIVVTDCENQYPYAGLGVGIFTAGMLGILVPLFIPDTATIVRTGP